MKFSHTTYLHAWCTLYDFGTMQDVTAPCVIGFIADFNCTAASELSIFMRVLDKEREKILQAGEESPLEKFWKTYAPD